MAFYDRVSFATATVGAGTITAGAATSGFRTMAGASIPDATEVSYCITDGTAWETGNGVTGSTATTLTRVLTASSTGALLSLSGSATCFVTPTQNSLPYFNSGKAFELPGVAAEPATPGSGFMLFYSKSIAGRMMPKVKGPSGLDYPLQAALWGNNTTLWTLTTATAGVWQGTVGAGAGTYTTALPTTTNAYTAQKRGRWANVVTTLNQVLGQRNTEAMFFRGAAVNQGGFFFFARCGFDVWTNGSRFFAGMHSATTVVSADPSALNNTVGFCIDAADNGAISFLTRDTAATKASVGMFASTNKTYDLYIFCASNSSQYTWRIVDTIAGTEASGTATATLPVNTTMLTAGVLASNAALTPVTSVQLGINRIYVETDY